MLNPPSARESRLFEMPISRINVIGTSGSGKSTFGRKLAATLQYPYIEFLNRLASEKIKPFTQ
jgi:adenylate kinase family enzyme